MKIEDKYKVDISIIIPLYKGFKYCGRLLKMLEKNCLYKKLFKRCSVEVIFVNDYPSEDIILENRRNLFNINICTHEKNQGIHAARVSGVKHAIGKYIIMLDQDDQVRENWLYSQWNTISEKQSEVCLCNGWGERFRTLKENDEFEKAIENRHNFIRTGNPIMSPGQAIIKKDSIPEEWIDNIITVNGADDFLLWIMLTKRGCKFVLNKEYIYYHSPERTVDSVDVDNMTRSLREILRILSETGNFLSEKELADFQKLIKSREENKDFGKPPKDVAILYNMKRWLKIKNQGVEIADFFSKNKYNHIAIYGLGHIGESLYYELYNSNVYVDYAVDKNLSLIDFKKELTILRWEDEFKEVDAVVVTLIDNYMEVIEMLKEKLSCPIILIEEILREAEYEAFIKSLDS